jgi:hypothetical protein
VQTLDRGGRGIDSIPFRLPQVLYCQTLAPRHQRGEAARAGAIISLIAKRRRYLLQTLAIIASLTLPADFAQATNFAGRLILHPGATTGETSWSYELSSIGTPMIDRWGTSCS